MPTTTLFTRKSTELTAMLSLAVADKVTVPTTVAPLEGAVSVTVGGVTSSVPVVNVQL